ncbi:MAG TPA: MFS transporter [Thermoleophilia bacterium]|nr:MFS transporter [Thermoleophilia bacterium]
MSSARPTRSFGWYVVGASFVVLFLNAGARLMIGVLFKPVIADFGWSRSAVSAAVLVNLAVFAVAIVVAGRLFDRYGPRWVILVSSVLFSGGLMLTAVMTDLWQFFLFYGVISAAGLGGTSAPIFGAIVSRWFERGRGTAVSLAMAGTSLGQFALVPLFTLFLMDQGWRATVFWVGVLCLVVNVVLVFAVLSGDHGDPGKARDRHEASARAAATPAAPAEAGVAVPRSLTLREAMRTASFWYFTVAMFICGAGDFLLTTHLVPMATDHGVATSTAVAMLAWFGLLSLGGILLAGPASDLIGDRVPIAIAFGLRVALFLLVFRYQNAASFWALALGFGFTFLVTAPLTTTLMGRLYGFAHIGLLGGFITTVHHVGGGIWAYLGGAVYDATGGYTPAMAISAVASAIALVLTLLIKEVRHVAPEEPHGQDSAPAGEPRFAGAATGARVVTRTRGM